MNMRSGLFSTVFADLEDRERAGLVPGLRYAEVAEITDEGYVLEWLTGTVRSRSAPARTARFMAGNERGAYFPYEVGDEVVVGFEDGNIDRPVILGGLWSDQDAPPSNVDTTSSNNTRSIVSREKSELTFDDTQSATKVLLKSAGGMQLAMDDTTSAPNILLETTGGMQLLMDDTPSAPMITLKTTGGIQLVFDDTPGAAKATLKMPAGMKLEFDQAGQKITLELNPSTKIELSSSAITVKGTKIDLNP